MKLVVISSPDLLHTEVNTVVNLFRDGLNTFHLRKPKFDRERMEEYLLAIPKEFRSRIVLHSHHSLAIKYKLHGIHLTRKHRQKNWGGLRLLWMKLRHSRMIVTRTYHRLIDLDNIPKRYAYVFLSPVFESISSGSRKRYSRSAISKTLSATRTSIYALGGISVDTIPEAKALGFAGAAIHGAMWNGQQDHTTYLKQAKSKAREAFATQPKQELQD